MPASKYDFFAVSSRSSQVLKNLSRLPLSLASFIVAAPLLVAVWVIAWSNLAVQTESLQQLEEDRVTRTSYLSAESLRALLVSADLVLLELRRYWHKNPNEFQKILHNRYDKMQLGSVFDVLVIDASGKVTRSSSPVEATNTNSDYAALLSRHKNDRQDSVHIGPTFFDRTTNRWQLPITRRLLSPDGKFHGIIVFLAPPEYFNRLLLNTSLPPASIFSIVDLNTGDLIFRSVQVNEPRTTEALQSFKDIVFWPFPNLNASNSQVGAMVTQLPPPVDKLSASTLAAVSGWSANGILRQAFDIDRVDRLYAWNKLEKRALMVSIGSPSESLENALNTHKLQHLIKGAAFSLLLLIFAAGFNQYDRTRRLSRQALAESEQNLRELAVHQTGLLEEERKFIAREIHDDLGQRLSVLRLDHAMLLNSMQSTCSADLIAQAGQVKDDLDKVLLVTRNLAQKVRPPSLEIGFLPAIEALCDEFQSRGLFKVNLVNNADMTVQSDDACAITAYRIVQEALTNAARHAQCQCVDIHIAAQEDWLTLQVNDDGVGFAASAPKDRRTFGLLGMRERVLALHGEIRMQSQAGQGCKLLVKLPLNSRTANIRPLNANP
jgi:signal transduction histidine kinase